MDKKLPARPHLDHLRRQAKTLLAALEAGDVDAIRTMTTHLPAARGMSAERVLASRFRLADAQSAIARKTGFASWPHLTRHVDQLRALEGSWAFAQLQVDGQIMPAAGLTESRVLIDGDCFRTESPEAIYEGVFNINVEAEPHEIDIEFVAGPEAGNVNFGVYRLDGDTLEICLDINGKPRPETFQATSGSGHAYETLRRVSAGRPADVAGGNASAARPAAAPADRSGFEFVESATLTRLQGEWSGVKVVRDGQELPAMMLRTGRRTASRNEVTISFGGKTMLRALVRLNEQATPIEVDYYGLEGAGQGVVQRGLMKWVRDDVCFCMAAPGQPRPADFDCPAGSGRTLSQWRANA